MVTRASRRLALALAGMSAVALLACQRQTLDTSRPDSARAVGGTAVSAPAALRQDDGQWVMPAKNYASTRFSGLDEINAQNVGRLGVCWTFSTGMVAGHEAAPLVVGSTMFIVTRKNSRPRCRGKCRPTFGRHGANRGARLVCVTR